MNLDADAVVFRLDSHQPQALDDRLRVGQPLGQLTADRSAHRHLQRGHRLLSAFPKRPGDHAEVRGSVVGCLQHWPQLAVAPLCKRQGVEDRWLPDTEAQATERHAHQVLCRGGICLFEQPRKIRTLFLYRACARRVGNLRQADKLVARQPPGVAREEEGHVRVGGAAVRHRTEIGAQHLGMEQPRGPGLGTETRAERRAPVQLRDFLPRFPVCLGKRRLH